MKKLTVRQLAEIIKAEIKTPVKNESTADKISVTGVSTDSRTIESGYCFFAIQGPNFDGHNYLTESFRKNAACAVISKDIPKPELIGKPLLKVPDTIEALGNFARHYRNTMNFKVVAITGSAGKTTTRQIAYAVLAKHFNTHQSPKNFNNNIGLPITLLSAKSDTQIIIAELATNKIGEISYLSKIACPDIAVITNIYPAHLAGFGFLDAIIKEKASITDGLKKNGLFIVNADFKKLLNPFIHQKINSLTFSDCNTADIKANNISLTGTESRFVIDNTHIRLPLPGKANIQNALAAWAICKQFDIKINEFAEALKSVKPIPMRSEILRFGNLTILNDCYNANPISMKNALQMLLTLRTDKKSRLVFICADMNELGQQAEALHEQLGKDIARTNIDLLLTAGPLSKITAQNAKKYAQNKLQVESFPDTCSVCNNLQKFLKNSDTILVKGSRVAKLELAVEKIKQLLAVASSEPKKSETK